MSIDSSEEAIGQSSDEIMSDASQPPPAGDSVPTTQLAQTPAIPAAQPLGQQDVPTAPTLEKGAAADSEEAMNEDSDTDMSDRSQNFAFHQPPLADTPERTALRVQKFEKNDPVRLCARGHDEDPWSIARSQQRPNARAPSSGPGPADQPKTEIWTRDWTREAVLCASPGCKYLAHIAPASEEWLGYCCSTCKCNSQLIEDANTERGYGHGPQCMHRLAKQGGSVRDKPLEKKVIVVRDPSQPD